MIKRKKVVKYDPQNYSKKGVMAGVVYGSGDKKIKSKKTVTLSTPRKTRTKVVEYGPIDYYGKQTKKKTITKTKIK